MRAERRSVGGPRESGGKYEAMLRGTLNSYFHGLGIQVAGHVHERGLMGVSTDYILHEAYGRTPLRDQLEDVDASIMDDDESITNQHIEASRESGKTLEDATEDRKIAFEKG